MNNIVIVGSSGHAAVVIDIVQQQGLYRIAGLIDINRHVGEQTLGCNVLGSDEDLPHLATKHAVRGVIVAIGDNFVRSKVVARVRVKCPELEFVNAIHPRASIGAGVSIGAGTVIMAGASINPRASVGANCIVNTNSSLDHDSTMGDFASIAPGCSIGGDCSIGEYSAIGIGAVMIHGVHIGDHSVIGAASLVMRPVGDLSVAYGAPAKVQRARQQGEKYL